MHAGLTWLTSASEGAPGHPAKVAFLRLVDAALARAVPPAGAVAGRRFRSLDLEAVENGASSRPAPYLYFTDSASNGREPEHSWFLSFGNVGADTPYGELLFPLNIEGVGGSKGHRRVQPVKVRLTSSHADGSAPPALSIVSPTVPATLNAVRAALLDAFGVEFNDN